MAEVSDDATGAEIAPTASGVASETPAEGDGVLAARRARHAESRAKWLKKNPAYKCWRAMHSRCSLESDVNYWRYGGRGIRVCDRWAAYDAFVADMGPRPSPECSIDRIDNNGNYEPGNCRWATPAEQARNTSQNFNVTYAGRTQCLTDWALEFGMNYPMLKARLNSGMTFEQAIRTPRARDPFTATPTGIRGVSENGSRSKPFRAQIYFSGRTRYIGIFATVEEAARAVADAQTPAAQAGCYFTEHGDRARDEAERAGGAT